MKKAKLPGEILSRASDLLNILKNFTVGKKETNDKSDKTSDTFQENDTAKKVNKNPDNNVTYNTSESVPYFSPSMYGTQVFQNVIEEHDKKIKNILKNQQKNKDNI